MKNLYKVTQEVIPPILFNTFKNSVFYKKLKPIVKKVVEKKIPPSWNQVSKGVLKGTWLFFYPLGEWQAKMLAEEYDKELFDALRKLNLKGKTIFDIGSHIGYHSIFFSKLVGPTGEILAFEPNPFNADRIQKNVDKNLIKNIKVNNIALSSENSETDFLFSENIENGTSSGGFIDESDTFYSKDTYENGIGFKRMKVITQKIDNLEKIKNNTLKIDILKIDVEGAESLVLEGGINTILRDEPIILIEIHTISNMFYFMDFINRINYTYNLLKKEPDGRHLILAKKK